MIKSKIEQNRVHEQSQKTSIQIINQKLILLCYILTIYSQYGKKVHWGINFLFVNFSLREKTVYSTLWLFLPNPIPRSLLDIRINGQKNLKKAQNLFYECHIQNPRRMNF